ncbi:MAG: hypothetical protein MJZ31_05415, partial [Bacteroidales bacterium]|nr:hypothetical protein [Bacteroidales bacterium]
EEDRKKYYRSLDDYWTDICVMESAVEEGFEKGMEKGLKKGMAMGIEQGKAMVEKNKKETALKMKRCGFPMEQIVLISGLSEEEIEKL